MATYAKINKYGFVEAPYRKVDKATGTVTDEVIYMTADEEDEYIVAQANEPLDENNHFVRTRVSGRHRNDIQEFEASQVDFMDVSPRMMVSVATACIPFLENDDCNRALMGSNMQRQAVPLMVTQQPLVATGMEYKAATDSGVCVLAAHDGTVEYVDADKIIVRCADGSADTYELIKFMRCLLYTAVAAGDAGTDEVVVLVQRLVGLSDDILVLLVGGHIDDLIGDSAGGDVYKRQW